MYLAISVYKYLNLHSLSIFRSFIVVTILYYNQFYEIIASKNTKTSKNIQNLWKHRSLSKKKHHITNFKTFNFSKAFWHRKTFSNSKNFEIKIEIEYSFWKIKLLVLFDNLNHNLICPIFTFRMNLMGMLSWFIVCLQLFSSHD